MNSQEILVFTIIILNTPLGLGVWLANRRLAANRQFFLLCVNLSVWLGALFFAFNSSAEGEASLWIHGSLAAGIWVPVSAIFLFEAVARRNWSFGRLARHLWRFVAAAGCATALATSPWILQGVEMRATGVPEPVFSPLILLLTVYHVTMIVFIVTGNLRVIRESSETQRVEAQYVMTGICMMYVMGLVFSLLLPVILGDSQVVVLAPIAVLLLNGVLAFGIATRRLLSVSVIVRQFASYALLAGLLACVYGIAWLLGGMGARWLKLDEIHLPHIFAAIATLFAFTQLHSILRKFVEEIFLRLVKGMNFDSKRVLQEADAELSAVRTNEDLFKRFKEILSEAAGTDEIDFRFSHRLSRGGGKNGNGSVGMGALTSWLKEESRPFVLSLAPRLGDEVPVREAAAELRESGHSVAVGVQANHRFLGSILLGKRLYGRAYDNDRLDAIQMLANQFGKALENAELYTRVQNDKIYSLTLLDNLVSGVVAVDREGEISIINREAQRILGLDERDGKVALEDLPEPVRELLLRSLESGTREKGLEVGIQGPDDEPLEISLGGAVFSSEAGDQLGALAVIHDVTLEKQLESLIRDQKKSAIVGEIAAHLAHEIRNPLTAVKTFAQLLPERRKDDAFIDKFTGIVREEVDRITDIIGNLLNYAKPKDDRFEIVHVNAVASSVADLLEAEFRKHKVTLELDLAAEEDSIIGSSDYLRQVFINILLNAKEAIDGEKGIVHIETSLERAEGGRGNVIEVAVEDSGRGMSEETLSQVFEPFFTTKASGTGIGLALTASLVKKQNGEITVTSAEGLGTAFSIRFPIADEEQLKLSRKACEDKSWESP